MKNGLGHRVALVLVPILVAWLYKIWFATCKIRFHDIEKKHEVEKSGLPVIYICWHYCILTAFALYRDSPVTFMVSASNDGDYLARMAGHLGFPAVRGSSNRKGMKAAKELIRVLRGGQNIGLVADGSQGPARIAQLGPVFLATKSGGPIMPVLCSVSRYYSFNTWDKLILPKLFSTIDIFYGDPLYIPQGLTLRELKEYQLKLEQNLNGTYDRVWQLQEKTEH